MWSEAISPQSVQRILESLEKIDRETPDHARKYSRRYASPKTPLSGRLYPVPSSLFSSSLHTPRIGRENRQLWTRTSEELGTRHVTDRASMRSGHLLAGRCTKDHQANLKRPPSKTTEPGRAGAPCLAPHTASCAAFCQAAPAPVHDTADVACYAAGKGAIAGDTYRVGIAGFTRPTVRGLGTGLTLYRGFRKTGSISAVAQKTRRAVTVVPAVRFSRKHGASLRSEPRKQQQALHAPLASFAGEPNNTAKRHGCALSLARRRRQRQLEAHRIMGALWEHCGTCRYDAESRQIATASARRSRSGVQASCFFDSFD